MTLIYYIIFGGTFNITVKLVGTNLDLARDSNGKLLEKTVTYNLNGGGGTPPETKSYARGQNVVLATSENITAPSGKHFVNWVTMKDGEVTGSYIAGSSTTLWEDLTLYAQWEN